MADNITAPGAGAVLATDDIGGVHHPLTKVEFGIDGVATPVSAASPLPVVQTGAHPLPTGASTEATLTALSAKVPTLGTKSAAGSVSVTPSSDQDPVFDHAAGVLVPITVSATLITTGASHKYIRISSDADALIRTDGLAAANDGGSIRIIANQPEVIPVPPGTAIKAMAVTGTANIRATPMAAR